MRHRERAGRRGDRRRRGFTLLEVVVALALGGIVLLGAWRLLEALGGEAERITAGAMAADADANGERLLRSLVRGLEIGTPGSGAFGGEPNEAHFTTWCDAPTGWQERCAVTLAIEPLARDARGDPPAERAGTPALWGLVAHVSAGAGTVLLRDVRPGGLRYLVSPARGGEWFRIWGEGITAPLAIGVVRARDTLIVRIGERG